MDNKGFATGGLIHNNTSSELYIQRHGEYFIPKSTWRIINLLINRRQRLIKLSSDPVKHK